MKLRHGMTLMATAIAIVIGPGTAVAATAAPDPGDTRPSPGTPVSRMGLAILAGGGVTDFTQGTMRDQTGVGGFWDVRALFATRHWIGFEASYIGGANPIQGLGLSGSSKLVRNCVEGAVRAQAPLRHGSTLLEPYVFGGVGWNGYRVTIINSDVASITTNNDNVVSLPFGVGFMVGYKGLVGDLRYTFRPTFPQTILPGQGPNGLTNWDVGAMIGFEF